MSSVHISKVRNIDESVRRCFHSIAKDEFFRGVKKVLIKPNFLNSSPSNSGITTDLKIVSILISLLKDVGIKKIFVGESSGGEETQKVLESLNVFQLEKIGASVVNFDKEKWIKVKSPASLALKHFSIPKILSKCDLLISAAKMKTHVETGVTLSMKNLLGAIPKSDRKIAHKVDIESGIVDVYSYFVKNMKLLSFVDCIYALDGRLGPTVGTPIKMDVIVAGNDVVATDAVCTRIMGYDPNKVKHIRLADELKLGSLETYISGEKIGSIRRKFDIPYKPFLTSKMFSVVKPHFRRWPYVKHREKCTSCGACIKSCPENAIFFSNKGGVAINYKKCISCLTCCEMCKNGVLDYKIKFPFSMIHKAYKMVR